jgi:hypothetical protein
MRPEQDNKLTISTWIPSRTHTRERSARAEPARQGRLLAVVGRVLQTKTNTDCTTNTNVTCSGHPIK